MATVFAFDLMMVESAAWITERKNTLSLALTLGSLLAYGNAVGCWMHDNPPVTSLVLAGARFVPHGHADLNLQQYRARVALLHLAEVLRQQLGHVLARHNRALLEALRDQIMLNRSQKLVREGRAESHYPQASRLSPHEAFAGQIDLRWTIGKEQGGDLANFVKADAG